MRSGGVGVSRQTLHAWLARYEAEGLDGLVDRSHRPVSCPHQMSAQVESYIYSVGRAGLEPATNGFAGRGFR